MADSVFISASQRVL